jgi:hypothetical protein
MAKNLSRPKRWQKAVNDGLDAANQLIQQCDEFEGLKKEEVKEWAEGVNTLVESLNGALEELEDLRSEYDDWLGNLPENLQQSELGSKLENISGLSFDIIDGIEPKANQEDVDNFRVNVDDASCQLDEAENAELPRGFGRD